MENKKFNNFVKILRSLKKVRNEEVLGASDSMTFIKIESVSKKNLPVFVEDLEKFSTKLDEAVCVMFRQGSGPDLNREYKDLLAQIKNKQNRMNHLSSFLITTNEKIEAAKEALEDYEKKIGEAELRNKKAKENMKKIRKSWRQHKKTSRVEPYVREANRLNFPTPWDARFKMNARGNRNEVQLHLEPIKVDNDNSHQTIDEEEESENDQKFFSDEENEWLDDDIGYDDE